MKIQKASLIVCAALLLVCNVKCADDCLYPCNLIHDPVCASDGNEYKYFANECSMDRHNSCESASKFVIFRVFIMTAYHEYSQALQRLMKQTAPNSPTTSIFWGKTIFSFQSQNFPPIVWFKLICFHSNSTNCFCFQKKNEKIENRLVKNNFIACHQILFSETELLFAGGELSNPNPFYIVQSQDGKKLKLFFCKLRKLFMSYDPKNVL